MCQSELSLNMNHWELFNNLQELLFQSLFKIFLAAKSEPEETPVLHFLLETNPLRLQFGNLVEFQ